MYKELRCPLKYEDVAALHAGDIVMISGDIFTGRSGVCRRVNEEGVPLPLDLTKNNVMLHSGPIIGKDAEGNFTVNAISITTSVRYNKWEADNIRKLGLRAIIAKGRVGQETKKAMQDYGCIHLCRTGTFAGAFALKVRKINSVHWLDLGLPEALWNFHFEGFGPLIVETDIYGRSVYDEVNRKIVEEIPAGYAALGITDFKFAEK